MVDVAPLSRRAGRTIKGEQAKLELADHALRELARLGYAHTSMRDIATAADMNLGRLNYYFEDKTDLIVFTIRRFKQTFVARLAEAVERGGSVDAVIEVLVDSATKGAAVHRFWYDLRTQSLFDPAFRDVVGEIEADMAAMTIRTLRLVAPEKDSTQFLSLANSLIDGVFFRGMQASLRGDVGAADKMRAELAMAAAHYRAS